MITLETDKYLVPIRNPKARPGIDNLHDDTPMGYISSLQIC